LKKLTGGEYNFIGTLNCVYGANILPKMKQDDFFCSQMLLKAMKNALIRYKSTPLLKDKQEIEDISQALAHLDPDLTLPVEIKEAIDKMPHYFTRKSFETLH
jgi:hypothetical protein